MRKFIKIFVWVLFIIAVDIVPLFAKGGWHPGHGGHHGGGCGAPEIDPSVASSAIALLTCGVLILTDKFRRKR
jgi:hypothetical protein